MSTALNSYSKAFISLFCISKAIFRASATLLDVSNTYELAIWIYSNLFTPAFGTDLINNDFLTQQTEFVR
jgi:hypothetical protein